MRIRTLTRVTAPIIGWADAAVYAHLCANYFKTTLWNFFLPFLIRSASSLNISRVT